MIEAVKEYLLELFPGLKIKKLTGLLRWVSMKLGIGGFVLPNRIYYRELPQERDTVGILFHEGKHIEQIRRNGAFVFLFKYLLCWPLYHNRFRIVMEAEAYAVSFMVHMIQDGYVDNPDIDKLLRRKELYHIHFKKHSNRLNYGYMGCYLNKKGSEIETIIGGKLQDAVWVLHGGNTELYNKYGENVVKFFSNNK